MGYRLSRLVPVMILAFVSLPVVLSCKGAEEKAGSGEIKIEAGEFYFRPASVTVKAGTPVKFVVTNVGKVPHTFELPFMRMGRPDLRRMYIRPGETVSSLGEITFSQPGTYEFLCGLPEHTEAGMKGTVKVVK